MARRNYLSHTSPEGRDVLLRSSEYGLPTYNENVVAGVASAKDAMEQWKSSDAHCMNMMSPRHNRFGVGHAQSDGSTYGDYWAQLLGSDNAPAAGGCNAGAGATVVAAAPSATPTARASAAPAAALVMPSVAPPGGPVEAALAARTRSGGVAMQHRAVAGSASASELEAFELLKQLRAEGFRCPGGQFFPPNADEFTLDCRLWAAANSHAEDMARRNYLSHTSPEGRDVLLRSSEYGLPTYNENVVAGVASAKDAMEQWKSSDANCMNMMSPRHNRFGVGHGQSEASTYGDYWAQLLGSDNSPAVVVCGGRGAAKPPAGECVDVTPGCENYPHSHCEASSPWAAWMARQCARYCGVCM